MTRRNPNNRATPKRAATAERDAAIIRARIEGVPVMELATRYGITKARVSQIMTRHVNQAPAVAAAEYRAITHERLELAVRAAVGGLNGEQSAAHVNALVRALETGMKLHGLDKGANDTAEAIESVASSLDALIRGPVATTVEPLGPVSS